MLSTAHPSSPLPEGQAQAKRRGLAFIFLSTFLELTGYFMLGPFWILQLKAEGQSTPMAGLFAATVWIGIFLVTPFVASITHRLGRLHALWLSGLLPVLTSLGLLLSDNLVLWFACQLLAGMAGGLRWVLAEAMVAECASDENRGRYVGLFETMVGLTFVLGPALLAALVHLGTAWSFGVAWTLMALGLLASFGIPAFATQPRDPGAQQADHALGLAGLLAVLHRYPVLVAAGFMGGFFENGLNSLLPLLGLNLGWSPAQSTLLVSASGLGSTLLMLPAGMLADHLIRSRAMRQGLAASASGPAALHIRQRLMWACAAITFMSTLLLPLLHQHTLIAWPLVFIWGGIGGALYTLAMIDIGSRETGIGLVSATGVLVMAYTIGGALAPIGGSLMLSFSPTWGFTALLAAVALGGTVLLKTPQHATA
jgi:MFS family permease